MKRPIRPCHLLGLEFDEWRLGRPPHGERFVVRSASRFRLPVSLNSAEKDPSHGPLSRRRLARPPRSQGLSLQLRRRGRPERDAGEAQCASASPPWRDHRRPCQGGPALLPQRGGGYRRRGRSADLRARSGKERTGETYRTSRPGFAPEAGRGRDRRSPQRQATRCPCPKVFPGHGQEETATRLSLRYSPPATNLIACRMVRRTCRRRSGEFKKWLTPAARTVAASSAGPSAISARAASVVFNRWTATMFSSRP